MIPYPTKPPRRRAHRFIPFLPYILNRSWDIECKFTTPKGLHNNNAKPSGGSLFQPLCSRLIILVKIVILDLTKIPFPRIQNLFKEFIISVKGETCITNPAICKGSLEKRKNIMSYYILPTFFIEGMDKIEINMIGLKTLKLSI